jgi:oligopeptidase B
MSRAMSSPRRALLLVVLLAGCVEPPPPAPPPPPSPPPPTTASAAAAPSGPTPPVARREPRTETLHGHTRTDDYAWLRNKGAPDVMAYLEAENAYTATQMKGTEPFQEALYKEMLGRIKETDLSVPYKEGDYYYYTRFEEGKQYPIHCRRKKSLDAPEAVILDLNELARTEKFVALGPMEVSDDGNLLAYGLDTTGFRQYELRVKDLRKGEALPERVPRVTSIAFAAGRSQLFYVVEDPVAKRSYRLYRHALGKGKGGESEDTLVYEEKDQRFDLTVSRSRSRALVFLSSESKTSSEVRYLRAAAPEGAFTVIAPREADHEYDAEDRGQLLYIRTSSGGRNFRLVTAPLADPRREHWKEIVPHRDAVMLERADVFKGFTVLREREGGLQRLRILDAADRVLVDEVPFPERVAMIRPTDNAEYDPAALRVRDESPITPPTIYDYDVKKRTLTVKKRDEVLGGYDPTRYAVERVQARAADGVDVPITLVHLKGLATDGKAPALMSGYGSYGHPVSASFSSMRVSLLDRGVVYVMAHVRGGGELGKKWHDHGRMMEKRNTFTDFIACAEDLVRRGVTSSDRLVIQGGSAGGLLMGAVTNLRPDLWKAVVAHVPFVDVINTMLDTSLPLTVSEFEEWGNPHRR